MGRCGLPAANFNLQPGDMRHDEGVPGSGYGCSRPCDQGDVNYVLRATIAHHPIKNSRSFLNPETQQPEWGEDVAFHSRTYMDGGSTSAFCDETAQSDGSNMLGPCLRVEPGQTMMIKVINDMANGSVALHSEKPELEDWQDVIDHRYGWDYLHSHGSFTIFNKDKKNLTKQMTNFPGWETPFDHTNLHVHGLQVVPHLFYPMGTSNPAADYITIEPDDSNGQHCFCYNFTVPADQPAGSYFYHTHRHGSAAMQNWNGMFGALMVAGAGSLDAQLAQRYLPTHCTTIVQLNLPIRSPHQVRRAGRAALRHLGPTPTQHGGPVDAASCHVCCTCHATARGRQRGQHGRS